MGDNRENSPDSRWDGPYEQSRIRAKVTAIGGPMSERSGDLL